MTSIRTIDDVIDVIQTDAEVRQRMVSALNVPGTDTQEKVLASVDRLTQNVDNLTTNVESLTKTTSDQGKSIDNLTTNVESLTRTTSDQGKRIDNLTTNVESLTRTTSDQGKRIDNLTTNVESLTKTTSDQGRYIDNLARTVGEQGRNIDNLSISLESLRGVVGDLSARVLGNDTEDRAVTKIISDLGVLFRGVRGTRLMYAQHGRLGLNDDYGQIVQAARDNDEIEPTDFRRLVSTDIVVSARREGRIHIFPAEVSNTLSKRDVDQAVRTSSLISQVFRNKVGPVTGTEYGDLAVQSMVAGAVVPDLVQDHADSLDVEVVTVNVPTMRSELERQSEWTS